jgi:hypothetical protein
MESLVGWLTGYILVLSSSMESLVGWLESLVGWLAGLAASPELLAAHFAPRDTTVWRVLGGSMQVYTMVAVCICWIIHPRRRTCFREGVGVREGECVGAQALVCDCVPGLDCPTQSVTCKGAVLYAGVCVCVCVLSTCICEC